MWDVAVIRDERSFVFDAQSVWLSALTTRWTMKSRRNWLMIPTVVFTCPAHQALLTLELTVTSRTKVFLLRLGYLTSHTHLFRAVFQVNLTQLISIWFSVSSDPCILIILTGQELSMSLWHSPSLPGFLKLHIHTVVFVFNTFSPNNRSLLSLTNKMTGSSSSNFLLPNFTIIVNLVNIYKLSHCFDSYG